MSALKFIALACAATAASAQNLRVEDHPDFVAKLDSLGLDAAGCSCSAKECACCADVKNTKIIKFDVSFCASLTLDDATEEITLDISVDKDVLYTHDFDVSELSKLSEECVDIFKGVDGCLELTNFTNNQTYIGACAGLELKIASRKIAEYDIGCFGLTVSNKDSCDEGLLTVCGAGTKGAACETCYTANEAQLDLDGCNATIVKELCGATALE